MKHEGTLGGSGYVLYTVLVGSQFCTYLKIHRIIHLMSMDYCGSMIT